MMPGPGSSWALLGHGEREEAAAVLGDGQQTQDGQPVCSGRPLLRCCPSCAFDSGAQACVPFTLETSALSTGPAMEGAPH